MASRICQKCESNFTYLKRSGPQSKCFKCRGIGYVSEYTFVIKRLHDITTPTHGHYDHCWELHRGNQIVLTSPTFDTLGEAVENLQKLRDVFKHVPIKQEKENTHVR